MNRNIFIPADFDRKLNDLKNKTKKSVFSYTSSSAINSVGRIIKYNISDTPAGNFVLVTGMASNCDTEHLMRAATYWALINNCNVYSINTFMADFHPTISIQDAQRNTFPEFVKLIEVGMDIIQKQCGNIWTGIIAHSAGAASVIEVFNQHVRENKPTGVNAAIMFAPYISQQNYERIKKLYKIRFHYTDMSDEEFEHIPLGLTAPNETPEQNEAKYITIFPKFLADMSRLRAEPELMNKYNIPLTIVGAGRDKKVSTPALAALHSQLRTQPNGKMFSFVEIKDSDHAFTGQHTNRAALLKLIRSVKTRQIG